MTEPNSRPHELLPPQYQAEAEAELEYSRRLERDIAAVAKQFGRCKSQWEINVIWDHLGQMIRCRTAQQIIRMETARGLR